MDSKKDSAEIIKLKDEQSFELAFKRYYQPLCSFALRYVGSIESAEEIVQEVFFKIWNKIDAIDIKTTVKSYLYGAVRNDCLNYLKHGRIF